MGPARTPPTTLVAVLFSFALASSLALGSIGAVTDGTNAQRSANDVPAERPSGFSGDIDLSTADSKLIGEETNDTAGYVVSDAGDVNGDGIGEVVVGAPREGDDNRGAAYLFYGPVDTDELDLSDADVKLVGQRAGDRAGLAVGNVSDLNRDGYTDVVVGAPLHDAAGSNAGAAYVVYGGESLSGELSLADADVKLLGASAEDRFGWAVDQAGTAASADGGLVVGAPGYDSSDGEDAGVAYLFTAESLSAETTTADADAALVGQNAGDRAGWSVATAGDVNGDGTADLLVGARDHDPSTGDDAGAAYLIYGAVSGTTSLSDADVELVGEAGDDRAGFAVSTAGDMNDDGYADVAVGAPFNDASGDDAGAAYVVFGGESLDGSLNLADADLTLTGEAADDRAGWSVADAGSGDVNCDGVADLLVGAPRNDAGGEDAGAAYLVAGGSKLGGEMSLDDAQATFVGEAAGDRAGWSVTGAGDVNEDGENDVLIGAPYNDNHLDSGAAYLLHSDCPEKQSEEPTKKPTEKPTEKPSKEPTEKPTEEPPTTTTTEVPTKPQVEFINCSAVRIKGDAALVELDTFYYIEGEGLQGVQDDILEYRNLSGTTVLNPADDGYAADAVNGEFMIVAVRVYEGESDESPLRVENPDEEECADALRRPVETTTEEPPTTTTTTTTTTEEQSEPTAEFVNCETVRIEGDVAEAELETTYYLPGVAEDLFFFQDLSGTTVIGSGGEIDVSPGDSVTGNYTINYVELYDENGDSIERVENPEPERCDERARPETTTTEQPTPATSTTTTTTTEAQPSPSIEYVDCDTVRIEGEAPEVEMGTGYYLSGGVSTDIIEYRDLSGTTTLHPASRYEGDSIDDAFMITDVTVFSADLSEVLAEKANPNMESCDERLKPEMVDVRFVDAEQVSDGTYEVTLEYTNPNDDALGLSDRIAEGRVNDEFPVDSFEPGTHQVTVTWTPRSDDERVVWRVSGAAFGLPDVSAESGPASEYGGDGASAADATDQSNSVESTESTTTNVDDSTATEPAQTNMTATPTATTTAAE